jgi:hypothetical protein
MEKIEKSKCQFIILNLIDCHRGRANSELMATAYIREFEETSRCDNFYDLKRDREDLKERINRKDKFLHQRILDFEETIEDEKVASQACVHYNKWHETQLIRALSPRNWFYYQTIERAERTLAIIGIFGAEYGGIKIARQSYRFIREELKKTAKKPIQKPTQNPTK